LALAAHVAMRDHIFGNREGQEECAGDSWIFMNAAMRDRRLIRLEFFCNTAPEADDRTPPARALRENPLNG
jgi:hypothetical protein